MTINTEHAYNKHIKLQDAYIEIQDLTFYHY